MTPAIVRLLTGVDQAEAILEELRDRHYFTCRSDSDEPVYQYHSLFRDFLNERGRSDLGIEACRQIRARAARILASDRQEEEALRLAFSAADWPLVCQLILLLAPGLLAQHRFNLLEQWLKQLPEDALNASPWFHYWLGCCRLPFDQRNSGVYFSRAYADFEALRIRDGMLLSASGAMLAIQTEWDDFTAMDSWIVALDRLISKEPDYPSASTEATVVLAMFGALLFRMPQHPKMEYWESEAKRLIKAEAVGRSLRIDIGNMLVHWQYWKGDLAMATHIADSLDRLVDRGEASTIPRLFSAMNRAIHAWHTARFDECLAIVDAGLTLADETGIYILNDRLIAQSIFACLSRDDLDTAKKQLDRMKPLQGGRRLAASHYHYLNCYYYLLAGDLEAAWQHGQTALDLNREVGTPFPEGLLCLTMAQVQFEMGRHSLASELLEQGRMLAETIHSRTLTLLCELISAGFACQQQKDEAMLVHLRAGLALLRQIGFLNVPGWRAGVMNPLLLVALENDIETVFVQQLIRERGLVTDAPPQASEQWPWPVKIYTLGRFSLIVDGKPLQFGGKAQQKPLELLKALIVLGGRDVAKDWLIDVLWPDTEGDKAQRALDTTLHRFRKLVGYEDVIEVQDRKLSFNARFCWIDVWAVERLLGQAKALQGCPAHEQMLVSRLQHRLAALYKGEFLSGDSEPRCIIAYRQRLQDRYLSRLELLGSYWENQADWDQAVSLAQQILELDERQEMAYQRLIICYRNKGLLAEAIAAYERCREILFSHYGVAPSSETEALYRSIR
ncbi:MAG: BTAD domain-containing putative transcriptional regulator [Gammaproteobacteria bacterium]